MMITIGIVGVIASFSIGWAGGYWYRGVLFDNLGWRCFRWNKDVFGFRPVPEGARLHRGDKLIMALDLDSGAIPKEGTIYGDDDA